MALVDNIKNSLQNYLQQEKTWHSNGFKTSCEKLRSQFSNITGDEGVEGEEAEKDEEAEEGEEAVEGEEAEDEWEEHQFHLPMDDSAH